MEEGEALATDPSRTNLAKDNRVESIEAEYVDEGVLLPLVLQYGTPVTALARPFARLEDSAPASPMAELIDVIAKEVEALHQPNSRSSTDTDVQAREGQT